MRLPVAPQSFRRHKPRSGESPGDSRQLRRTPYRPFVLRSAVLLLVALALSACDLPRDPQGTLDRVRGGTMRVGVVERRPWTTFPANGGAGGLEGALVAELARELGARIEWVRSTESQLLEALKLRELDIVIGGFTDDSPWARHVAFTRPFYTDTIVVAAPSGAPLVRRLDGREVAVSMREPEIAAYVRTKGGTPRLMRELGQAPGLVAAPSWHLGSLALRSTGIRLHETRHVIAAAPGENAWLMRLEKSIAVRKPVIPSVLRMTPP